MTRIATIALGFALALAPLFGAGAARAEGPSFDCARAEHEIETLICKDARLAALDREIARLYRLAHDGPHATADRKKELAAYQRGWIKGRNDCWKAGQDAAAQAACTADVSMIRIMELRQGYADARSQDEAGVSGGPLAIACEGWPVGVGFAWAAVDPGLAVIQWMDRTVVLEQAMSGSGVRYVREAPEGLHQLWTKGNDAMLTIPEKGEMTCRLEEIG